MSERPLALVTNDDGVDSPFLHALLAALQVHFRVLVAAPASEQSWIGRAMSRRREVTVEAIELAGAHGWMIDGTPTDCVNLALGHLLSERPAVVVSGINIGYNTTMPLLLSSGTLAGALEGAHWGLPAVAASQALPHSAFAALQSSRGELPEGFGPIIEASAAHAASIAAEVATGDNRELIVHNLNYPVGMRPETPVVDTVPAHVNLGGLFAPCGPDRYAFRYGPGTEEPVNHATDRSTVENNAVSWSRLNFSSLTSSIGLTR
ncbi:MAG: 5'/3'-nucleotidase SurE [Opitutales bacterium]